MALDAANGRIFWSDDDLGAVSQLDLSPLEVTQLRSGEPEATGISFDLGL
jgi:hypothetical protein